MKRISIVGVLVGGIVDIVATNIFAFPFILYVMIARVDFLNMPQEEITTAITQAIQSDWILFTIQLLIGGACSVLGGYIASLIAKHDELLNGALSAYFCVGLGIFSVIKGLEAGSIFLIILGFILSPALGLLGGYLRLAQKNSKQKKSQQAIAV